MGCGKKHKGAGQLKRNTNDEQKVHDFQWLMVDIFDKKGIYLMVKFISFLIVIYSFNNFLLHVLQIGFCHTRYILNDKKVNECLV